MNFDRIAPFYGLLERLVFGRALQRARTAFVRHIASPARVLILGEGNGRFLAEFVRAHPSTQVDCIDASARMLKLARARTGNDRARFIQVEISTATLPAQHYDLIVTHFVLDCFEQQNLRRTIDKLSRAATDQATWLIAEFCLPPRGWRRLCALMLVGAMYQFFRLTARIEAHNLPEYESLLQGSGFRLAHERMFFGKMIRSQQWERRPDNSLQQN